MGPCHTGEASIVQSRDGFDVDAINGEPGVTVTFAGRVVAAIALDVRDGRVMHVHGIGNPAKLHFSR